MLAQAGGVSEIDWAQTGMIGFLVLSVLWAGIRRKWIFVWQHDEITQALKEDLAREREESREWRTLALTQAGLLEATVERTTKIVHKVVDGGV